MINSMDRIQQEKENVPERSVSCQCIHLVILYNQLPTLTCLIIMSYITANSCIIKSIQLRPRVAELYIHM